MEESTFKHEMAMAKTFHDLGVKTDYWRGYMKGLRRSYHGENFGTDEDHRRWLSVGFYEITPGVTDDIRLEMSKGYRAGFEVE